MAYTIGIDIGTYSSKGVLLDRDGIVKASAVREHELSTPRPGWAEHDAQRVWWEEFCQISRELLRESGTKRGEVLGVGLSGIAPCVLPVDEQGNPLRPAILYGIDTRATGEIERIEALFGGERIRKIAGSDLSSQSAGPKILWIREREPEVWKKTRWIMNSSSYLAFKLTGEVCLDNYTASSYHPLFDVNRVAWSEEGSRGICPLEMLPRPLWAGERVGTVTADACEASGLAIGTPVIAGTADAAAEAVAAGVSEVGETMIMYGSSTFFIALTDSLKPGGTFWPSPFLWPGSFAYAGGTATAGSLTEWFRREFLPHSEDRSGSYQTLAEQAASVPPGSRGVMTLPYFSGERTPLNDPKARGVIAGLTLSHTRADIYRSMLEAVGYSIRHNLEEMEASGAEVTTLYAIGGGTRNSVWMRIVTDIIGKPQLLRDSPGAAYGDALLAAVEAGVISKEQIPDLLPEARRIDPREAAATVYDRAYRQYRSLYQETKGTVHALAEAAE
ncbi:MAG: FGGY-family carbohydrate kinase [Spirochaetaceae bacterium]